MATVLKMEFRFFISYTDVRPDGSSECGKHTGHIPGCGSGSQRCSEPKAGQGPKPQIHLCPRCHGGVPGHRSAAIQTVVGGVDSRMLQNWRVLRMRGIDHA
jgi:hypothetical protein